MTLGLFAKRLNLPLVCFFRMRKELINDLDALFASFSINIQRHK